MKLCKLLLFAFLSLPCLAVPPIPPVYRGTEMVPWVEVNSFAPTYINSALKGLKAWRPYCSQVIVTTVHGNLKVYRGLAMAQLQKVVNKRGKTIPPLKIIPGIKPTSAILPALGDVTGWQNLATNVVDMLQLTGSTEFVWELEGVMEAHRKTGTPVDWPGLLRGLECLPKTVRVGGETKLIQYLLYPALSGSSIPAEQELYRTNVTCWHFVFGENLQCIDHTYYKENYGVPLARKFLRDTTGKTPTPMVYMYDGLDWSWNYTGIKAAMYKAGYPKRLIVYPGWERFPASGTAIGKALWP